MSRCAAMLGLLLLSGCASTSSGDNTDGVDSLGNGGSGGNNSNATQEPTTPVNGSAPNSGSAPNNAPPGVPAPNAPSTVQVPSGPVAGPTVISGGPAPVSPSPVNAGGAAPTNSGEPSSSTTPSTSGTGGTEPAPVGNGGGGGSAGLPSVAGGSAGVPALPEETPIGEDGPDLSVYSRVIYAAPDGLPSNSGESAASPLDLVSALGLVQGGEAVVLAGGTYAIPYSAGAKNTLQLAKSGTEGSVITMLAFGDARAVLDFSFPDQQWVQDAYGLFVTGSYWTFYGIDITRAGYQGAYVTGTHNTFENCRFYDNRNSGLEINKGGAYTTVINCDAFHNFDPKKNGSMADGFAPKQTQGPGNRFRGCRAWENSDDGFDTFDSPEAVIIENSWAFENGIDVWQYGVFEGNGNGFKVGGNYQVQNNVVTHSVAFGNPKKGFDQNNNAGGITIYNSTGFGNGTNFGLGNAVNAGQSHDLANNISVNGAATVANAMERNNSWSAGFSATEADFQSVDLSLARADRNPDGSLPESPLFRLTAGSALNAAGIDVGLPFEGAAPNLGAF